MPILDAPILADTVPPAAGGSSLEGANPVAAAPILNIADFDPQPRLAEFALSTYWHVEGMV